jgi:GT2 family glycosyltransferase
MYADRRCRILPLASSHHFALRAEALIRLGDRDSAVSDLATALELSPEDIQANRRMLSWGDAAQKAAAAQALVASDDDAAAIGQALDILRDAGRNAVAAVRISDETITGWAAWDGPGAPVLTVTDHQSDASFTLMADARHPLAERAFDNVVGFQVQRTESPTGHAIALALSGEAFFRARAAANASTAIRTIDPAPSAARQTDEITVIVPIYRDFAATRVCLESLEPEIAGNAGRHAILINDATPEPRLERHLRSFAGKPGFTVLVNDSNLGFVGSVNRALTEVMSGDVVLLNADTIVPPGCFERMASIARSDPAIGTVTPLSNNGEFTSFPVAFTENPLPTRAVINDIDEVAAVVNRDQVVDLPNGIGFCMLVTRRCLEATGLLSHAYQRGYLEDVDFCLRARERGFRNVCAPSIYVGHHGTRSFGADKRALVVRNIAVAEQRFPDYRQECALFMAADPLRRARAAIERRLVAARRYDRLLVCGSGLLKSVAEERARHLRNRGKKALLFCVERSGTGPALRVRDTDGAVPQSLTFQLDPAGLADLRDYAAAVQFGAVEVVEPSAVSDDLLQTIEGFGGPIKVLSADAGLLCPRGTLTRPDGGICATLGTDKVCEPCASSCGETRARKHWRGRWTSIDKRSVVAPCEQAEGFAAFMFAGASLPVDITGVGPDESMPGQGRTGLIVQGSTVDEFQLVRTFLREAVQRFPQQAVVVVGKTADDLALMAIGNAFVSGAVDAADCAVVLRQYGIDKIFVPLRRPLYGHPLFGAARQSGLPMAYFDWSFGKSKRRDADLAIDPRCSVSDLAPMVGHWAGLCQ